MLKVGKKRRERLGITYFGLMGHEIAVLKSTMESTPDLAADYELREPNEAGTCDIVVVNQDSQVATSVVENLQENRIHRQYRCFSPILNIHATTAPIANARFRRPSYRPRSRTWSVRIARLRSSPPGHKTSPPGPRCPAPVSEHQECSDSPSMIQSTLSARTSVPVCRSIAPQLPVACL